MSIKYVGFSNYWQGALSRIPNFRMLLPSPPSVLHPEFNATHPFPPLPKINSEAIRRQVFTHRSFYARPNHVFEDLPQDPSPDNEK
jgi:ribonuclease-3